MEFENSNYQLFTKEATEVIGGYDRLEMEVYGDISDLYRIDNYLINYSENEVYIERYSADKSKLEASLVKGLGKAKYEFYGIGNYGLLEISDITSISKYFEMPYVRRMIMLAVALNEQSVEFLESDVHLVENAKNKTNRLGQLKTAIGTKFSKENAKEIDDNKVALTLLTESESIEKFGDFDIIFRDEDLTMARIDNFLVYDYTFENGTTVVDEIELETGRVLSSSRKDGINIEYVVGYGEAGDVLKFDAITKVKPILNSATYNFVLDKVLVVGDVAMKYKKTQRGQ